MRGSQSCSMLGNTKHINCTAERILKLCKHQRFIWLACDRYIRYRRTTMSTYCCHTTAVTVKHHLYVVDSS